MALTLLSKPFHQKPLVTLRNWDPDVLMYKLFPMFILDKETVLWNQETWKIISRHAQNWRALYYWISMENEMVLKNIYYWLSKALSLIYIHTHRFLFQFFSPQSLPKLLHCYLANVNWGILQVPPRSTYCACLEEYFQKPTLGPSNTKVNELLQSTGPSVLKKVGEAALLHPIISYMLL